MKQKVKVLAIGRKRIQGVSQSGFPYDFHNVSIEMDCDGMFWQGSVVGEIVTMDSELVLSGRLFPGCVANVELTRNKRWQGQICGIYSVEGEADA